MAKHIVRVNICILLEISKTIYFEKLTLMNLKINVYICTDASMAESGIPDISAFPRKASNKMCLRNPKMNS